MRARVTWVWVLVGLSATVGVGAAVASSATTSAASADVSRPHTVVTARDMLTPQIRSLSNEAEQLGAEITAAQGELARLEREVAYESTLSRQALTIPATTVVVAPTASAREPVTRETTSTTTSSAPLTTESSTTSTTPAPVSSSCAGGYTDQSNTGDGAGCSSGGGYDN